MHKKKLKPSTEYCSTKPLFLSKNNKKNIKKIKNVNACKCKEFRKWSISETVWHRLAEILISI